MSNGTIKRKDNIAVLFKALKTETHAIYKSTITHKQLHSKKELGMRNSDNYR